MNMMIQGYIQPYGVHLEDINMRQATTIRSALERFLYYSTLLTYLERARCYLVSFYRRGQCPIRGKIGNFSD